MLLGKRHPWVLLCDKMQYYQDLIKIFYGIAILLSLSSCNVTKYLQDDEFLLQRNTIKFDGDEKIANRPTLRYELSTLYKQKPNTNFLFLFPREWFYYATRNSKDTKFRRWQRRVIAEPPAIYNRVIADSTGRSMVYFLQYNAYYSAEVFAVESPKKRQRMQVVYHVKPGKQTLIDTVIFQSRDSGIHQILQRTKDRSMLKQGEPLTLNAYEREKERIARYLRNNGYAYFYAGYVAPLDADTAKGLHRVPVYLEVLPPARDSMHQLYTVGRVVVYPQYDPLVEEPKLRDTLIGGVLFKTPANTFRVRPQTLLESISLRSGDAYSQDNYDKTIRQLSALGTYKFVRIKEEPDSLESNIIHFRIELTRNPKMEFGVDLEINYTNRSVTSGAGNLIGMSLNPSLRNRNFLGGAELLITNLSAGVEVNPAARDNSFWNTIDLRLQSDLYFPKFHDYMSIWRGLYSARISSKGGIISDNFYRLLHENANTRLSASYNYLLLLGFYRYNLLNASYGYDVQRTSTSTTQRFIINHVGVDYLRPITEPAFDEILRANTFLERSFGQQLFVSLLFRDFSYTFNSRPGRTGHSHYFGFNVEMAGAEIWAGNSIYNAFALRSDTLRLGKTDFSQYVSAEIDYRHYKQFSPKNSTATRISIGLARPFGYTTDVPYVKQFYVGGPNSIRGWAVRALGPGGYEDPDTLRNLPGTRNRLFFYQTGDLKMEFSFEYRYNIFWRLNGAFFLDGGNVWTLRPDPSREGARFLLRRARIPESKHDYPYNDAFYQQIALSSGMGLRFDFSYFVFRLDMGVRLRNPYPLRPSNGDANERDYWYDFNNWRFRDINFNLGLGYPF